MTNKTPSYEGKEPFIFISYSHKNEDRVHPIIDRLTRDGYRVWYDEGINPGTEWPEVVAAHLNECAVMLALISSSYLDSPNCKREIDFAIRKHKPMLYALLEDVNMTLGMEMQLSTVQGLDYYQLSEEAFYQRLYQSDTLNACKTGVTPDGELSASAITEEDDERTVIGERSASADSSKQDTPKPVQGGLRHLPAGVVVRDKYRIEKVLGEGGFGITYLGEDLVLGLKVAIKEYYPFGIAYRTPPEKTVNLLMSEQAHKDFEKGKSRFLREAQTLARFAGDPAVVTVRDFFEENNTAYLVMEYVEGETLSEIMKRHGRYSQEETLALLDPVMQTLSMVHERGIIHRDISPSNLIMEDGQLKLLDFGAADVYSGEDEKSHSVIMKPGYAPQEQYRRDSEQGPWTDIYALCATMYRMLTKTEPQEALGRMVRDVLKPPSALGAEVTPAFEAALMKGLSVYPEERYRTIKDLLAGLHGSEEHKHVKKEPMHETDSPEQEVKADPVPGIRKKQTLIAWVGIAVAALIIACVFIFGKNASSGLQVAGTEVERNTTSVYISGKAEQELTADDLKNLTKLNEMKYLTLSGCNLDNSAIEQIGSLKMRLERLILMNCTGFDDLSALSDLQFMNILLVTGCELDDAMLSKIDFERMESLRGISLNNNPDVTDITPIEPLTPRLMGLWLSKTGVKDYHILDGAPELLLLSVKQNQLSDADLASLSLPKLERLYLDDNHLTSMNTASEMPSLKIVSANRNQIKEITGLKGTAMLEKVYLDDNAVTDLTPLSGHTELEILHMNRNHVRDIDALADSKKLTGLQLCVNELTSLAPLGNHEALEDLRVSDNKLESLEGLSHAINLKYLKCENNALRDISGLENVTRLEAAIFDHNLIESFAPLSKSSETMKHLSIADNPASDLSFATSMTRLEYLDADNCGITDLEPLYGKEAMQVLSARHNQITSIKPLANTSRLTLLFLGDNEISDMSPVEEIYYDNDRGNKYIELRNNNVTTLSYPAIKEISAYPSYSVDLAGNPISAFPEPPFETNYFTLNKIHVEYGAYDTTALGMFSEKYVYHCPLDKVRDLQDTVHDVKILSDPDMESYPFDEQKQNARSAVALFDDMRISAETPDISEDAPGESSL